MNAAATPSPTAAPVPPAPPALHPTALRLGYLALVPFIGGAALVWFVRADVRPVASALLSAYATVVIAFLGGIHWGFGFRVPRPTGAVFGWGVTPPLAACLAVMMPPYAGLVLQGLLLVVCYLVDRKVYPTLGAGAWLTLRFRLTAVASLSCFIAAAGTQVAPPA